MVVKLETKRTYLRKFIESDVTQIFKWGQNPVYKRTAGFSNIKDKYQAKQAIAQYMARPLSFAVVLKETDEVIGVLELSNRGEEQESGLLATKELGLMLDQSYWGQHIMSEVLPLIIDFARDELHLTELWAGVYPDNKASKNLLLKFHFEYKYQVDYSVMYQFADYQEDYYRLKLN